MILEYYNVVIKKTNRCKKKKSTMVPNSKSITIDVVNQYSASVND